MPRLHGAMHGADGPGKHDALTTSAFCGQGFPGPSASLHVFDRGTGRTVRLAVEAPELENSYYIYEVVWYDALQVLVRLMNRYELVDQQLFHSISTVGAALLQQHRK